MSFIRLCSRFRGRLNRPVSHRYFRFQKIRTHRFQTTLLSASNSGRVRHSFEQPESAGQSDTCNATQVFRENKNIFCLHCKAAENSVGVLKVNCQSSESVKIKAAKMSLLETENVYLFIPNLIGEFPSQNKEIAFSWFLFFATLGYARIVLAIVSFYFMPTNHVIASWCYIVSVLLDALDGHAARKFNQCKVILSVKNR